MHERHVRDRQSQRKGQCRCIGQAGKQILQDVVDRELG